MIKSSKGLRGDLKPENKKTTNRAKLYLLSGGAVGGIKLSCPRLTNSAVAVGAVVPTYSPD